MPTVIVSRASGAVKEHVEIFGDTVPSIFSIFDEKITKISRVIIPDGVTTIEDFVFWGYSSLACVKIPESVTAIGRGAFSGCSSLASVVIPDGVTKIEKRSFRNCSSLVSVVIPDGVTEIGEDAFENCSSLVSVKIPESVTTIESFAFDGCSSLASVKIPESATLRWFAFDHRTTVLARMSWSLENFKRCDRTSKERVRTILLCLCRLEIPAVVLRRFLNFLDLTRVLEN